MWKMLDRDLPEASAIRCWRQARPLAEGRGERACLAKADRQCDIRYRRRRLHQQCLGVLDATAGVISMRR